jgi:hypothetical protein
VVPHIVVLNHMSGTCRPSREFQAKAHGNEGYAVGNEDGDAILNSCSDARLPDLKLNPCSLSLKRNSKKNFTAYRRTRVVLSVNRNWTGSKSAKAAAQDTVTYRWR